MARARQIELHVPRNGFRLMYRIYEVRRIGGLHKKYAQVAYEIVQDPEETLRERYLLVYEDVNGLARTNVVGLGCAEGIQHDLWDIAS